jgi:sulfite reductase alpha subunit-like flavoprotein
VGPRSCFAEDRGRPEHLTVAAVRYESHGRQRKGVASTFLVDRVSVNDGVPMFVHIAKGFRFFGGRGDTTQEANLLSSRCP